MSYKGYKVYKNFSLKESKYSGGAPRIVKMARAANDIIIGNQANAILGFTTYNTTGVPQTFDTVSLGLTQGSFNNTYRMAWSLTYQADQVTAWPEIARLYSQYRIVGVKVTIIPMSNMAAVQGLASIGETVFAHDYADNTTATDENELLEMQGVKTRRMDKPFSFFVKPVPRTAGYDNTGTSLGEAISARGGWCTTLIGADATHYGTKFYTNNISSGSTSSVTAAWKIRQVYYLELKDST